MKLQNDLILRVLKGEKTERVPVWMMRQAGRVLPEYRALRARAKDFKTMIKNPEMAAEATIQPVDRFGVDAAIIFSDILVVPEAMGLSYEMAEEKGPVFPTPIANEDDIKRLRIPEVNSDLSYTLDAIRLVKETLNGKVPLIGFAGAPWTIFAYMVEGKGSKTFSQARKMLYAQPNLSHKLLDLITESTTAYLNAQIEAGADVIQIFDSWAGVLPPGQYREFSLRYMEKICRKLTVPVIVFGKGAGFSLMDFGELPCQAVGLDWNIDPVIAREAIGDEKVLQGNLDPCALYAPYDTIRKLTKQMIRDFGTRYIANLAHGLYPDTDVDKAKCFVDAVKEFGLRG